jgi:hypothetical protein
MITIVLQPLTIYTTCSKNSLGWKPSNMIYLGPLISYRYLYNWGSHSCIPVAQYVHVLDGIFSLMPIAWLSLVYIICYWISGLMQARDQIANIVPKSSWLPISKRWSAIYLRFSCTIYHHTIAYTHRSDYIPRAPYIIYIDVLIYSWS